MGQSLTHLLVHAVFSTKDRRPFLRSEEIRNEMYADMAGTLKNLDCHPIKIGGVEDHVHVFCSQDALVRHIVLVLVLERVLLVAALDLYRCTFSELRPADAGLKMLSGRVA